MEVVGRIQAPTVRHRSVVRARLAPSYEQRQEWAVGCANSVLDVGCGANSPLGRFAKRYDYTVGVDCFAPAIARSRSLGVHDDYLLLDIRELEGRSEPRSFDVVVAFDVIEHLDRQDGAALLATMERIARERIVLFTPNGFLPQDPTDGNPRQRHHSGWAPRDFSERGYEVFGVHGLRQLRGQRGSMRWWPGKFWGVLSDLTQPLVWRRPSLAYHLLCVKEVAGR